MFALGAATRIYVATGATDMRIGFDGLWGKIRDVLECDPASGHIFFFKCASESFEVGVFRRLWALGMLEARDTGRRYLPAWQRTLDRC